MKKTIVLFSLLALFVIANAQQNFQGQIIYKLHASADNKKPDAELKVLFGVNKIKIWFKEKEEYEKDALIVRLDSAATFVLKPDDKVYTKKMLQVTAPVQMLDVKSINGYSTRPFIPESNGLNTLLGGFLGSANTVFFIADSLHYFIPAPYAANKEFLMIQKNKIVLGAEVKIQANSFGMGESNDEKNSVITAEAIEIKPMIVNEEEFAIPAGYNIAKDEPTAMVDSVTTMMVDTAAKAIPVKKITTKKPAKPNKSKTPIKSSAVRRKE
jgi:hypothetical protein